MIFKCEVAHETERALREGYHGWYGPSIELLCGIQQGSVATQSDNVVNLVAIII